MDEKWPWLRRVLLRNFLEMLLEISHHCNGVVFTTAVTWDVILYTQPSLDLIVQEIALVKEENDLGLG